MVDSSEPEPSVTSLGSKETVKDKSKIEDWDIAGGELYLHSRFYESEDPRLSDDSSWADIVHDQTVSDAVEKAAVDPGLADDSEAYAVQRKRVGRVLAELIGTAPLVEDDPDRVVVKDSHIVPADMNSTTDPATDG